MDPALILVQVLNGTQLGVMLFLIAAGLTLVFGVMDLINLAHGSLYMVGAYLTATFAGWLDSGDFGWKTQRPRRTYNCHYRGRPRSAHSY